MKLSQRESVFMAVCEVLGQECESFGEKVSLNNEQKKQVTKIVTDAICGDAVDFSDNAKAKYSTPLLVEGYVRGMVNNWLTKDTRLNGGSPYTPKNPGVRRGSSDPIIKEMQKLKSITTDPEALAKIDAAIEAKKVQIAAEKAKSVAINADMIPDELKHLLG